MDLLKLYLKEFLNKYSKKSEIYKLLVLKYWVKFTLSKNESNDLPNCDLFNILSKNYKFQLMRRYEMSWLKLLHTFYTFSNGR